VGEVEEALHERYGCHADVSRKGAKAQRRKGAKKSFRNAVALCALAPLREDIPCKEDFRAKPVEDFGREGKFL
jgi:hypothetical protein